MTTATMKKRKTAQTRRIVISAAESVSLSSPILSEHFDGMAMQKMIITKTMRKKRKMMMTTNDPTCEVVRV